VRGPVGQLGLGLLIVGSLLIGGCREEGPAEKAGRKVDEAVERLRHGDEGTLEKAGRKVDEAVDRLREGEPASLEKAGRKVDEVVDGVGDAIEDLGEKIQGQD